jgi:predicted enzyme related to lactoylglutathione lyase
MKVLNTFSSFSVTDVPAAKKFYGETLGLDVKNGAMGFLEIDVPGGGHVTCYPKPDHQPATFTVLNLIVPNIDEAVDELNGKGVTMEQYDFGDTKTDARGVMRDEGPPIAWFKDPSGNVISVIETMAGYTD